jgi:hypothetical protein
MIYSTLLKQYADSDRRADEGLSPAETRNEISFLVQCCLVRDWDRGLLNAADAVTKEGGGRREGKHCETRPTARCTSQV